MGTYLCPSVWSSSLGFVESCPWILIPTVATALFRIEPIASTDSFSRTSTLHLLSRAAFTWKDGFSVVAPIKVTVPHSTCGRKVSYRRKHIQIQVRLILLGIQKGSGAILVSIRHCCYMTVTHNTGFHRMLEFKASVFRINTV